MARRRCAFIVIGGVEPRKKQVDHQPRSCPSCGLPSARLKRLDHYVTVFFIPLIPIKRGGLFLECSRCGGMFSQTGEPLMGAFPQRASPICPRCGEEIDPGFKFCPYCGQRI